MIQPTKARSKEYLANQGKI